MENNTLNQTSSPHGVARKYQLALSPFASRLHSQATKPSLCKTHEAEASGALRLVVQHHHLGCPKRRSPWKDHPVHQLSFKKKRKNLKKHSFSRKITGFFCAKKDPQRPTAFWVFSLHVFELIKHWVFLGTRFFDSCLREQFEGVRFLEPGFRCRTFWPKSDFPVARSTWTPQTGWRTASATSP